MITATGLGKSFGAQVLFEAVDFQLNPGCRYGLVGANGAGKTTLMNILAGFEEATAGQVSRPKRLRLGTLSQDQFRYEETPILEVVMQGHGELWAAMHEKGQLLDRADEDFDGDRYAELEDVIVSLDGYSFEARCGEILEGLGS
jgi:ATPase subunit of ABC transporter with duplicated ATPase domains